jgi:crossover junction endodeoxyribonuclease RuvC
MIIQHRAEAVYYELVRRHAGTDAAHIYGAFLSELHQMCERYRLPCTGVTVQAIKKFATGKGNASKDEVIEAVRSWGYDPIDDNEADAIALAHLKAVES